MWVTPQTTVWFLEMIIIYYLRRVFLIIIYNLRRVLLIIIYNLRRVFKCLKLISLGASINHVFSFLLTSPPGSRT